MIEFCENFHGKRCTFFHGNVNYFFTKMEIKRLFAINFSLNSNICVNFVKTFEKAEIFGGLSRRFLSKTKT